MAAMRINTKCRYGTRIMLSLALRFGQGPVQLREIAAGQEISLKYMEHVIASLRDAGLVYSLRGRRGGYKLARQPREITVHDIVTALQGALVPVGCLEAPEMCSRVDICVTRDVWHCAQTAIVKVLQATTLEDLVVSHRKKLRKAKRALKAST